MTTRPGIIMPAVPFASRADRESALTVMRPIMTYRVRARQIMTPGGPGILLDVVADGGHPSSRLPAGRRCRRNGVPCHPMTDLRFADDRAASRYTLHDGDDLVSVLDYRDDGRTVALTRAFTIPTFRGRGYAAVLVERAVDAIEKAGDREILPVCWYVGEWFEAHPERGSLLHARR